MKNKALLATTCAFLLGASMLWAQKKTTEIQSPTPSEMTKEQNMNSPVVPAKIHQNVASYMQREAQALVKLGYFVETDRNGEVIVVTIPANLLFEANERTLKKGAEENLKPFASYLRNENRFKILLAMHSDNTGSDSYKEKLTTDRLNAITAVIERDAQFPDQIVGYAMADDEPIRPHSTRANREKNRRLEIYIVPSGELLEQLKKK